MRSVSLMAQFCPLAYTPVDEATLKIGSSKLGGPSRSSGLCELAALKGQPQAFIAQNPDC